MKIVYASPALRQLDRILTYIEERSPQGAIHVKKRIHQFIAVLVDHPFAGHTTNRIGQRRMVISPYPYAIFYRVSGDAVVIQRIRHTARRPI